MKILSFLLLVALLQGCDSPKQKTVQLKSASIVNGADLTNESAGTKFTIYLQIGNQGTCTGSLIAPNVVLTAAHCVATAKAEDIVMKAGAQVFFYEENVFTAKIIIKHPGWSTEVDKDDIALIILSESLGSEFKPIAIFDGPLPSNYGVFPLEAYGYSKYTTNSSIDLADYFRDVVKESFRSYHSRMGITDLRGKLLLAYENPYKGAGENYILVNQIDGGICPGDSGGPMVVTIDGEKTQIGVNDAIVSLRDAKALDCSSFAISTHVLNYIPWINETLAANGLPPIKTAHFSSPDLIADPANTDTSCIYAQGNVTNFLEDAKENIVKNICDEKLNAQLTEYIEIAKAYCTNPLAGSYVKAFEKTLESVSANCK